MPSCASFCVRGGDVLALLAAACDAGKTIPGVPTCLGTDGGDVANALSACCSTACTDVCGDACKGSGAASPSCQSCVATACPTELTDCQQDHFTACNPITSEPCDVAGGASCDLWWPLNTFRCFGPPNDATLCGSCDSRGPRATTGVDETGAPTTDAGVFARYCCVDADCGTGTCHRGLFGSRFPTVGVCDAAAAPAPGCDAPPMPASGGTCYTVPN